MSKTNQIGLPGFFRHPRLAHALVAASLSILALPSAQAETSGTTHPSASGVETYSEKVRTVNAPTQWTPVIVEACFAPRPFAGSEKEWHLAYDAILQNFSRQPAALQKFAVEGLDKNGKWSEIKNFDGESLKSILLPIAQSEATSNLSPGSLAALFINLSFADRGSVPVALRHHIVFAQKGPIGKVETYDYRAVDIAVEDKPAVRIGAPLRGGKWVACGGYVGTAGHRQAIFAIENGLHAAQLFAIDWVRLGDDDFSSHDIAKNEAYACYGEPVYAVRDGRIWAADDRFADQSPSKAEGTERFAYPGGNSVVQDIGDGYYAFYAHFKPGSLRVKAGDLVKAGQIIGLVGNSGNSTGPHLHMHVTRNPGILEADCVPYVFENFKVLGQIGNFPAFLDNDSNGKKQQYQAGAFKGEHHDELIREGFVIDFGPSSEK